VASYFCLLADAGADLQSVALVVKRLESMGVGSILDYAAEKDVAAEKVVPFSILSSSGVFAAPIPPVCPSLSAVCLSVCMSVCLSVCLSVSVVSWSSFQSLSLLCLSASPLSSTLCLFLSASVFRALRRSCRRASGRIKSSGCSSWFLSFPCFFTRKFRYFSLRF
jgi:hypothetical protein